MVSTDSHSDFEKRAVRQERLASIGRLAVNLIHELSNPLDGILRYVRLIIDQMPEGDPKRDYAEQARDGLVRVSSMVSGLTDFTRRIMVLPGPADVNHSIEAAIASFSEDIKSQNIEVKTDFDKKILIVLGSDIGYLFANILKNAIQAMPDGGVLSVKAKMIAPRVFEARFSDTGPGIPAEIQKHIFDPFFTTKDVSQGVGLGLFISREIAESYDGTVELESKKGKGTTFIVTLPVYRGNILVMDDEKQSRDVAAHMLIQLGYRVVTAADGAEAIELYRQARDTGHPYNIAILDLTIPGGLGGAEVLKEILKLDPQAKAIISSGYSSDPIMSEYEKHGFKGAICKPYSMEDMEEAVEKVMAESDYE